MLRLKYRLLAATLSVFALITGALAQGVPTAADFMRQGDAAFSSKNYAAALDDYSKAISADPGNFQAFRNRCNTYMALRQYDKSLADCNEVIKLKPDPTAYFLRAQIYSRLKQLERGMEDATVAIQLKPDFYSAYCWRAAGFKVLDKNDRALEDIDAAIKLAPGRASDYDLRCDLNRRRDRNDLALADGNEAIRIDPKFAHAYYDRGLVYRQLGKYTRAIEDEKAALKIDPKFSSAYDALGSCDLRLGKYELCLEEFATAAKMSPKSAGFLGDLGTVLIRTGDLEGGERVLQQAAKLQENRAGVLFGLALLQIKRKDIAGANENLGKFRAWMDRYDSFGWERVHEAQLLLDMNRPSEALNALAKQNATAPGAGLGEKLALQSCAHRMLGNSQLADSELAKAKGMLPESALIYKLARGTFSSLGPVASKAGTGSNNASKSNSTASKGAAQPLSQSAVVGGATNQSTASANRPQQLSVRLNTSVPAIVAGEKFFTNAVVSGGTQPYRYEWFKGHVRSSVFSPNAVWSRFATGTNDLKVVVTDASGAHAEALVQVAVRAAGEPAPDSLEQTTADAGQHRHCNWS